MGRTINIVIAKRICKMAKRKTKKPLKVPSTLRGPIITTPNELSAKRIAEKITIKKEPPDISQYEGLERKNTAINQRIDRIVNAIDKSKKVRGL